MGKAIIRYVSSSNLLKLTPHFSKEKNPFSLCLRLFFLPCPEGRLSGILVTAALLGLCAEGLWVAPVFTCDNAL